MITRNVGGTVNYGAASIADADGNITNNGVVPWATINARDWATKTNGGDAPITAYATYTWPLPATGASSAVNYNHTNSLTLTASESVNTLKLNNTAASYLSLGGYTLTLPATACSLSVRTLA